MGRVQGGHNKPEQAAVVAEVQAGERLRSGGTSVVGLVWCCLDPTERHKGFRPRQLAWLSALRTEAGTVTGWVWATKAWLLGLLKGHLTPRHTQQGWPSLMATLLSLCQLCLFLTPHKWQSLHSLSCFCDADLWLLPGEPALWWFPWRRLCVLSVHNEKMPFRNCFLSSVVGCQSRHVRQPGFFNHTMFLECFESLSFSGPQFHLV